MAIANKLSLSLSLFPNIFGHTLPVILSFYYTVGAGVSLVS